MRIFSNYDDTLPVLFKAVKDCSWDDCLSRCRRYPEEAKIFVYKTNLSGSAVQWCVLPIHQACAREAPQEVIQALLNAYPESILCRGYQMSQADRTASPEDIDPNNGNLPIHYACEWGASVDVVKMLLKPRPDTLQAKDRRGLTPTEIVSKGTNSNKAEVLKYLAFMEAFENTTATPPASSMSPRSLSPKARDSSAASSKSGDAASRIAKLEKENASLKRKINLLADSLRMLISSQRVIIDTAVSTKRDIDDVQGLLDNMSLPL